uniref:Uncharacterized protein n=1 Tax=Anguilla anguilla TaxID=7936 RepID=A0A0E9UPV8_ANGAN
MDGPMKLE